MRILLLQLLCFLSSSASINALLYILGKSVGPGQGECELVTGPSVLHLGLSSLKSLIPFVKDVISRRRAAGSNNMIQCWTIKKRMENQENNSISATVLPCGHRPDLFVILAEKICDKLVNMRMFLWPFLLHEMLSM